MDLLQYKKCHWDGVIPAKAIGLLPHVEGGYYLTAV